MVYSLLDFFLDPILRAPTIGCMLMGLASSLIGVLAFTRKRSLIGEALAHASYPGIVIGVIVATFLCGFSEKSLAISVLCGAFFTALCGLICVGLLQRYARVASDTALCFVLAMFFGVGILMASRLQFVAPLAYQQAQFFLLGQAAIMTDIHVKIYGVLAVAVIFCIFLLYRPFQLLCFDQEFGKSVGLKADLVRGVASFLYALSIVIGLQSVGVVLMSGMLIAPAAAARQWTFRFSTLFFLAGFIGLFSGFSGNYLSLMIPVWLGGKSFSLPTGPMILLSASSICFLSILFAVHRGIVWRFFRIARFKDKCLQENLLKAFWRQGLSKSVEIAEICTWFPLSALFLRLQLFRLTRQGWLKRTDSRHFELTSDGWKRATHIVRLHRLWEVYLVDYLGQSADRVHRNAEEMEHILTPALEQELTLLLNNPRRDPHAQPIPENVKVAGLFSSTIKEEGLPEVIYGTHPKSEVP